MPPLVLRRRQPDRLSKLAGKRGLVAVAAVLCDLADGLVGQAQAAAGKLDTRAHQVLSDRHTEQRTHAKIELECREAGQRRQVADTQRRIQMHVNVVDAARQAGHVAMRPRQRLQVARYAAQADDTLVATLKRLFPGQAPALFAAGVEMKFKLTVDRPPGARDGLVLRRNAIAEHSRKHLVRKTTDQVALALASGANDERLIDRDITPLGVLQEKDGVGNGIEQLVAGERASQSLQQAIARVVLVGLRWRMSMVMSKMTMGLCRFRMCHCNFCQDNATTARR